MKYSYHYQFLLLNKNSRCRKSHFTGLCSYIETMASLIAFGHFEVQDTLVNLRAKIQRIIDLLRIVISLSHCLKSAIFLSLLITRFNYVNFMLFVPLKRHQPQQISIEAVCDGRIVLNLLESVEQFFFHHYEMFASGYIPYLIG